MLCQGFHAKNNNSFVMTLFPPTVDLEQASRMPPATENSDPVSLVHVYMSVTQTCWKSPEILMGGSSAITLVYVSV